MNKFLLVIKETGHCFCFARNYHSLSVRVVDHKFNNDEVVKFVNDSWGGIERIIFNPPQWYTIEGGPGVSRSLIGVDECMVTTEDPEGTFVESPSVILRFIPLEKVEKEEVTIFEDDGEY